jgi:hypothetical protein
MQYDNMVRVYNNLDVGLVISESLVALVQTPSVSSHCFLEQEFLYQLLSTG